MSLCRVDSLFVIASRLFLLFFEKHDPADRVGYFVHDRASFFFADRRVNVALFFSFDWHRFLPLETETAAGTPRPFAVWNAPPSLLGRGSFRLLGASLANRLHGLNFDRRARVRDRFEKFRRRSGIRRVDDDRATEFVFKLFHVF